MRAEPTPERTVRRVLLLVLLLSVRLSGTAMGQLFAGDSLRVRGGDDGSWHAGRLVRQDFSALWLRSGDDTLKLPVFDLQRVERWHRNERKLILLMGSVGMLAGTLAYYMTPETEERVSDGCVLTVNSSVCTSHIVKSRPGNLTAIQLGGAGGGLLMGVAAIAIWPGQWKVVINR